jgi:folylpolyglutamate synthase/dihydropteroate synthase
VLSRPDRRYQLDSSVGSGLEDIDDLNSDIAHAAMILLSRQPKLKLDKLTNGDIADAVKVRPPCRFEVFRQVVPISQSQSQSPNSPRISEGQELQNVEVEVEVILDIAHNEDAIVALVKKIKKLYPGSPVRCVYATTAISTGYYLAAI